MFYNCTLQNIRDKIFQKRNRPVSDSFKRKSSSFWFVAFSAKPGIHFVLQSAIVQHLKANIYIIIIAMDFKFAHQISRNLLWVSKKSCPFSFSCNECTIKIGLDFLEIKPEYLIQKSYLGQLGKPQKKFKQKFLVARPLRGGGVGGGRVRTWPLRKK